MIGNLQVLEKNFDGPNSMRWRELRTQRKLMFYICWFVHTYWFLHVSIHICSWSSLTKYVKNAVARSWSWFKWGDRVGVVIWWKICWHVFLRGHLREIFVWKPYPFRKIRTSGQEETRPGGGIMNMCRKKFSRKPYRLHQSCLWYHNTLWHRSAHNSCTDGSTTQVTASFNLGRKMF